MQINTEIIDTYLRGETITKYKNNWIYTTVGKGDLKGKIAFEEPRTDTDFYSVVAKIAGLILDQVKQFIPNNVELWDVLFPKWKSILNEVSVNLVIGLPPMYDATVAKDKNGKSNVILDLGNWVKYDRACNVSDTIHNLLSHELAHICIGVEFPRIEGDGEGKDYITCLDALTFNEGLAHLISYKDKMINEVDWNSITFQEIKQKSQERLQKALLEKDEDRQKKYVYDAIFGEYYEKYACMAGMLYFAKCWEKSGIKGLLKVYRQGYHGFAEQTASSPLN